MLVGYEGGRALLFPARRKSFCDCFCRGFTNNSIVRFSRLLTKIILLFREALFDNDDADVLHAMMELKIGSGQEVEPLT